MADQTTANIRIVLEDASDGGTAPAPTAGQAAQQPVKSPDDITKSLPMWHRETKPQRQERDEESTRRQDDDKNSKARYREAQEMISGLSRGMYFAEHFGMTGMVGAAGQWLEAAQSGMKLAGAGAAADAIAGPVGVAVAALGLFALVVDKTAAGLSKMAERAGNFSGEVAGAQAFASAMRTQFEMQQADRYGSMLAQFEVEQSKLGMEWQRTLSAWLDANSGWIMTTLQGTRAWLDWMRNTSWSEFITNPSKVWDELLKSVDKVVNENDTVVTIGEHLEAMRAAAEGMMAANGGNPANEWMAQNRHFEMADVGVKINAFVDREADGVNILGAGALQP